MINSTGYINADWWVSNFYPVGPDGPFVEPEISTASTIAQFTMTALAAMDQGPKGGHDANQI